MGLLRKQGAGQIIEAPQTLEEVLTRLEQYGQPRVGQYDRGWHAHIEMFVAATGGRFDVRSDFGMASPMAADVQCLERVLSVVE